MFYLCEQIEKKRKNNKPYKIISKHKTYEECKKAFNDITEVNKYKSYFTCTSDFIN